MVLPILESILPALIGALSGIGVVLLRDKLNKGEKVTKARRAIYAEMTSADLEVAQELIDDGYAQPFYRQVDFLPTDVYDNHVSNIGLLTEDEIASIVAYYSLAKTVKSETSALHAIAEGEGYEHLVGQSAIGSLKNDLETL